MPEATSIQVRGARVHNLKNLDVDIPLNALTVVTGVSGSGKSSLAFDTIYAEGQRRYVESLSAYARQFLERMEKPDVDAIEGIAPAVAIRQKSGSRNPRSTVATATEIYDYLRLLYARIGETVCPDCSLTAVRYDVDTAVTTLLAQAPGRRALLLFPVIVANDSSPTERLTELRGRGFNRLWQAGTLFEFSTPESLLDLDREQPFFALLDRLVIESDARARIVDAIEIAYREAGEVLIEFADTAEPRTRRFHPRLECTQCRRSFATPEPSFFAFNSPAGACPRCQGFGRSAELARDKIIPHPGLSLQQGAIEPWSTPARAAWRNALRRVSTAANVPMNVPWSQLTAQQQRWIWNGVGKFPGVVGFFERLERKKYKVHVRVLLSRYRAYETCPDCLGQRLRPEALWVRLRSGQRTALNLAEVVALTVEQAQAFLAGLRLGEEQTAVAATILLELRRRLDFLHKVGLEYLTLDRLASTLSGGEAQRIQLATCLGSQLVGSLYVLDEPSIGLHPRDTARLTAILHELRDLGNSVLVVEHDPEMMRASDHLLDLGPGAGEQGGAMVAAGTWRQVSRNPRSLTGQYLSGKRSIAIPLRRSRGQDFLVIQGASAHNLKHLDVEIPLGCLVAVTGVSGSGKSTLVHDVLHQNLQRALHGGGDEHDTGWINCRRLRGLRHIHEVVLVDQSPIGRTPRSNPVTYIKAFDGIRELFARQPEARRRGLKAGDFSFNVPGGRCETCQGDGVVTVDMQFLADVELVCDECAGTRYQAGTLAVEIQGKNIHQVLQMSINTALVFFAGNEKIVRPLRVLDEVGLGYLRLGQSATTLSGGEAQRVKLATHLAQPRAAARTLFLFDEPTTGLHFDDIAKLLGAFQRLLTAGASIVVIEHNLDVIKTADWIIDLGPEAGDRGGELVVEGPPEVVAEHQNSRLAGFLRSVLGE